MVKKGSTEETATLFSLFSVRVRALKNLKEILNIKQVIRTFPSYLSRIFYFYC
ncbi:hypothetical protein J27TS8_00810 [Robertmurraya siralis]|uniref:Uncharacterized protein n=1 Tax=Robertmurraya siralis TaxID=77777 RepID=A0A919WDT7_9BACI|nr:hypothetical protein J27TS8_00810 [Robertmurraya siralis]